MKIYLHSCHAVLEYDQAKMLMGLGHEVVGLFDVGSEQRPKIKGVTDRNVEFDDGVDLFLVHQLEEFERRAVAYASLGKPVVVMAFGQGSREQHRLLAQSMHRYKNLHVCAYSVKDHAIYCEEGAPCEQLRLIRFGKDLKEFGKWKGGTPRVLVMCNDIHRRGEACGWDVVHKLSARGLPITLCGNNTDKQDYMPGLGQVDYDEIKHLMRSYRVAFNVGTIPAPYTLSLVEQICTGMPVVAWDNGCGIVDEGLDVHTVRTEEEAEAALSFALASDENAGALHELSVQCQRHFDVKPVTALWKRFLSYIDEGEWL